MSYCDCDYGFDGDPPKVVHIENIKRARKEHKCIECTRTIQKGEAYQRIAGVWYDGWDVWCTCHLCLEIEQWAKISAPCFCSIQGELHTRVKEMVQDVAPHVPGFFFEYGRRAVRIRQNGGQLT